MMNATIDPLHLETIAWSGDRYLLELTGAVADASFFGDQLLSLIHISEPTRPY